MHDIAGCKQVLTREIDKDCTNVRAAGGTRIDGDDDSSLKLECQSGGTVLNTDTVFCRGVGVSAQKVYRLSLKVEEYQQAVQRYTRSWPGGYHTCKQVQGELTLATMGMSKAGRANWEAASHPAMFWPRLSASSNEAEEAELAYLLTRVSICVGVVVVEVSCLVFCTVCYRRV